MFVEKWLIPLICFGFLGFVLFVTRAIPALVQFYWVSAWQKFARSSGLMYIPGFFFATFEHPTPRLSGIYHGRSVVVNVDTRSSWGFGDADLFVTISLENPPKAKFPSGGVVFLRKKTGPGKFFQQIVGNPAQSLENPNLLFLSNPVSLGTTLCRESTIKAIVTRKGFFGLLIRDQSLYFQKRGVDSDHHALESLLDQLCDLAGDFERYAKAWMK